MREVSSRPLRVAHVVRRYGVLTEPFIEHRVRSATDPAELWSERLDGPATIPARVLDVGFIRAGSVGDRVFHRLPQIGPPLAAAYAHAEADFEPSVIHAHYLTTAYLVGTRTRAPLVVSVYGFDVNLIPQRGAWRGPIRAIVARARAVLVEGPYMRQTVIDLGFAPDTVRVVPIAASLDGLVYRDPPPVDGPVRLLSCGRMVEKKGHDTALEAFAMVRSRLPRGSTLTIVGDGPLRESLERSAGSLGLGSAVEFTGALSRSAYLDRLAAADILVAASRRARNGDGEGGAPTTILDAQAIGVLTVGSRHQDIPSLIEDGSTGYLVAEGDPAALGAGIERAVLTRAAWAAMTRRARVAVEMHHADRSVSSLIDRIHREVARP